MKKTSIRFPHQLFKKLDLLPKDAPVFVVEETLFFNPYSFHKQELLFHRASMKYYADYLADHGKVETEIGLVAMARNFKRVGFRA